jgi:hydroxyacylglutathione hydrolase
VRQIPSTSMRLVLSHLPRTAPLAFRRQFSSSAIQKMKVVPVPVREDNYAYLLIDEKANKALAVDPYDVPKVQSAAQKAGVELTGALTTHHHHDHSGGNEVSNQCI